MNNATLRLPRLMDSQLQEIGRLHPVKMSLEETLTPLSSAEITLPPQDPAVRAGQYAELYTSHGSAGFYRITSVETTCSNGLRTLTLTHALCTLADNVLFGYHAFDDQSYDTAGVIRALLAMQKEPRWTLGACEVSEQLIYTFETGNLLDALLSVLEPLTTPCMLDFDFTTQPWTLHLHRLSDTPACECRPGRNLKEASVTLDRSDLCTRIYPLGYGEGADQLSIRDVNGGVPYLDADTQSTWGIVEKPYADTTITAPETLLASARALLETVKNPIVTVEISALELSHLTGESLDCFTPGVLCRLPLPDYHLTLDERIIAIRRPDVYGSPCDVRLTLANRTPTIDGELTDLSRKALISRVYSQGAASEYALHFGDNADADHPARLRFYIDEDALHVNKVMVRYELQPFRGYARASSGGGKSDVSVAWAGGSLMDVTTSVSYTTAQADQPHTHDVDVDVALPRFVVNVPSHTHGINLGIYEGSTADSVSITVDGTPVPVSAGSGSFDAVDYLARNSRGKIRRGAWHEIVFTPSGESRIAADVHVRTFIRTITGANL